MVEMVNRLILAFDLNLDYFQNIFDHSSNDLLFYWKEYHQLLPHSFYHPVAPNSFYSYFALSIF